MIIIDVCIFNFNILQFDEIVGSLYCFLMKVNELLQLFYNFDMYLYYFYYFMMTCNMNYYQ
jgi:hypothetical protein